MTKRRGGGPGRHLLLFLATCLTTTWAGASHTHPDLSWWNFLDVWPLLVDGIPFSVSLMAILTSHEMGHYVAARLHRVEATLPVFLPLPFGLIGTFGAVIGMPAAVRDRNALADIGAAGPLAGLVVAIPVLIVGLHLSPVEPSAPGALVEGNSLLYVGLKLLTKGMILPGNGVDVYLHPVAWAGWVGLLVTMINLLPIGQLDGGHIAFAYFGERHEVASLWLHRALIPMAIAAAVFTTFEMAQKLEILPAVGFAVYSGMPWIVWWILLTLMRRFGSGTYHPPVDDAPLTPGRRRLCQAMFAILLLILTPIPLRMSL